MAKLLHHRRSGLGLGFVFSPLPHYPTPQGNAHLPSQVIDKVSTINLEARSRCPIWIPIWPLITIRLDHRFAPVTRLPPRCCSGKLRALLSARLRSKSINLRIPLEGGWRLSLFSAPQPAARGLHVMACADRDQGDAVIPIRLPVPACIEWQLGGSAARCPSRFSVWRSPG